MPMKRLLILCFLAIFAFGGAASAKAEFLLGINGLDESASVLENLQNAAPGVGFTQTLFYNDRNIAPELYLTFIAVNEAASDVSLFLNANIGSKKLDYYSGGWGSAATEIYTSNGRAPTFLFNAPQGTPYEVLWYTAGSDVTLSLLLGADAADTLTFAAGSVFGGLVIDGQVMALVAISAAPPVVTPVPAAVWLFGTGLAGVAALRRKMA